MTTLNKKIVQKCLVMFAAATISFPVQMIQAQKKLDNARNRGAIKSPATPNRKMPSIDRPATNTSVNNTNRRLNNNTNISNRPVNKTQKNIGNRNINSGNNNININVDNSKNIKINNNRNTMVRHNNHRPYNRPPYRYGGRRYYCYHPYRYHPYRPFYWGPSWHPWGFFIKTLAVTAIIISIENQQYHYDQGVYYMAGSGGYTVVQAPVGASITTLPPASQTVVVNETVNNYYYGGTFYEKSDNGYTVVPPTAGTTVESLPEGGEEVKIGDQTYVKIGETYYQPVEIDGKSLYEVAEVEEDK
jgi:Family of unknown function (DUF6515)